MSKSYAHLLGFGRGKVKAESDQDKENGERRAEDGGGDEKERERDREDDNKDDRRDQEDKEDDQRRDREDEDDAEEDDEDNEKKADDDTDDKRDDSDKQARAARGRERARCRAIFSSKHAAGRPDVAAHLAFNTRMTRKEARGLLAATAKAEKGGAATGSLRDRMAGMEQLRPGQDASARGRTPGSAWDASARRVGVTPRR